jgi:hypothetical protein
MNILQVDIGTQTEETSEHIEGLQEIISRQNRLIDQSETHLMGLRDGLDRAKVHIDYRDGIINDHCETIRNLEAEINTLKKDK